VYLEGITNLSATVKENMNLAHNEFQNFARDLMRFNITFQAQSTLFTAIRQLAFSLLRVVQQIDGLIYSIQTAMLGRVPIGLVSPSTLLSILKNVSLELPTRYKLAAGVGCEDAYSFYELVKVSVMADHRGDKLILTVPL
jgi:hypothetical protein